MLAASLLSSLKAITAHTAQSLPDFSTLVWAWFYVWTSPAQALWEPWRIRFEQTVPHQTVSLRASSTFRHQWNKVY